MRAGLRIPAAEVAFFGAAFAYLVSLGFRPLLAPDELRYAEAAREMVASGDWVVPHLVGVPYFEKPILGYWAIALSLRLFGESAFAVRLPSALASLGMGVIVWRLARRFGPGPGFAPVAGVGFLTSVGVAAVGTTAVFDPIFSFALTATLAAFFVAVEHPPGRVREAWLAASGVACGLAFLTKGFLAFALPVSVVAPFLLLSGRLRESVRLAVTPLLASLATAAPWSLAIALREPGFWHHFVVHEHLRRFSGGAVAQHVEPFWFYVPVFLVGALPWTPLLFWTARRRVFFDSPLARFAACWLVGPTLLLSASSGKLPTYVLPCFPPLFLLLAAAAASQPEARRAAPLRALAVLFATCLGLAGFALLTQLPWVLGLEATLGDGAVRLWTPWAVGLLLAASVALLGAWGRSAAYVGAAIAAATWIAFGTATAFFPTGMVRKTPGDWIARHVMPVSADAIVVSHRHFAYALCWLLKRNDVRVLGPPGELGDGLARPEQADRLLDDAALASLVEDAQRARPVVVMALFDRVTLPSSPKPSRSVTADTVAFREYPPLP